MKSLTSAIFLFVVLNVAAAFAADPKSVAESALTAWSEGRSVDLLAVAHPELIQKIRSSRLLEFHVAQKPQAKGIPTNGSDSEVVALFCEALSLVAPRDKRFVYIDDYETTEVIGDKAHVVFMSSIVDSSGTIIQEPYRKKVLLLKSGEKWKLLWLPSAQIHIDLLWEPISEK